MNPQLREATRRGVEVNQRRARLKRELKSGEAALSQILRDGVPDWLGSMNAEALLCMAPRVRRITASSLLQEADLSPVRQARKITIRQRILLAGELEKIEALVHRRAAL